MSASGHTIASEVGRDGGSPSDLLHEAAALMRQRAEAATVGPWVVSGAQVEGDDGMDTIVWTYTEGDPDLEHVASWHPDVAPRVADLVVCPCPQHALAVARVYLGRES